MFEDLPKGHFGAILADPPWHFQTWTEEVNGSSRKTERHYETMTIDELEALPISDLAASDCVLFVWVTWPMLEISLEVIKAWGFSYKSCAFDWMKANARQLEMFRDDTDVQVGLGYWTRSCTEPCLLATRGKPKRLNADVRQGIIEPRREHSRKPAVIHERIERLVTGPYLELFARQSRSGWTTWGDERTKFDAT